MIRILATLTCVLVLLFYGCDKNEDKIVQPSTPVSRNLSQEDLKSIKYATFESYDAGWTFLVLSSSEERYSDESINLIFHIDPDVNWKIQEGTIICKETQSFNRYAQFICNKGTPVPNDIVAIKKLDQENYSISFSYQENNRIFEGTYTGKINYQSWAIDFDISGCK